MKGNKASARYAKSLLELAIENNQVDAILKDVQFLNSLAEDSRDLELLIQSPIIDSDKKIKIFNELFGHFQPITKAFLELITKKGREAYLLDMAFAFEKQVNQHKGITPIKLTTAVPLSESLKNRILDEVKKLSNGTFETTEIVDPEIIGGFVVRTDGKQIDVSVATQLKEMKQSLTR